MGIALLILASALWGSSFPVIKLALKYVDVYTYLWLRSAIALSILLPFALRLLSRDRALFLNSAKGGTLTGIAYLAGLGLQGLGISMTTASKAAFITGFSTVFVHLYTSLKHRHYRLDLLLSLVLAFVGLYLMTRPSGGMNLGDMIILASAGAWAAQVILVSRYSSSSEPFTFVLFETAPTTLFVIPSTYLGLDLHAIRPIAALSILYLALTCSVLAFSLQVVGQRSVDPATAVIIYQTEPVFASIVAWLLLGECMEPLEVVGAALILIATLIAARGYISELESKELRM